MMPSRPTPIVRPYSPPPGGVTGLACGGFGWLIALGSLSYGLSPLLAVPWEIVLVVVATWHYGRRPGLVLGTLVESVRLYAASRSDEFAVWGPEGVHAIGGLILTWLWVDRRRRAWDHMQKLARRDYLTQIANRQALAEALEAEWGRLQRHGHPFAVAVLDCDGFKALNDSLGHLRGDTALVQIAATLRRNLRSYDTAARLGGDEFVIVLAQTDLADAEHVLERLRTMLHHEVESRFPGLGVTIGVVVFRTPPDTPQDCLKLADAAMYRARQDGPGRTEFEVHQRATPTVQIVPR
jgi:diguanylate cyclase (GGDEF)-like protein